MIPSPKIYRLLLIWAAASVAAGWDLAALHGLSAPGYAVAWPLVGLGLMLLLRERHPAMPLVRRRWLAVCRRRFRRPLPLIFLIVAGMALAGGILYAPNNYDALTYRLPRMLNWLYAGTWFWIPTPDPRLNFSGTTWEWMAMPVLALLHSDRGMFLINLAGFLMLPGLLFSIFLELGVTRRVAWVWMWVLPCAYGYATQAGGIGNDLFGAVLCLLSVYFGLRARRSDMASEAWLALLAAALMTGEKLSNLPLALACLVAVWPMIGKMLKFWPRTLAVACLAAVISALPIMALNQLHTGNWTGDPHNAVQAQVNSPAAALLGNGILLVEQTFMPPLLPGSRKIQAALEHHVPPAWHRLLKASYPRYYLSQLNEIPGEEAAGVGLGITLLVLIGTIVTGLHLVLRNVREAGARLFPPVVLAAWIATAVYLLKMGSEAAPRLMLPYYPLALIPFILMPAQRQLLHRRWWRVLLVVAALSVFPAMILSVSRPLWPAQTISAQLARAHPDSRLFKRLNDSYGAYARRNDVLAPIRAHLPAEAREIAFAASPNDASYSLWRPIRPTTRGFSVPSGRRSGRKSRRHRLAGCEGGPMARELFHSARRMGSGARFQSCLFNSNHGTRIVGTGKVDLVPSRIRI